jgi:hypothetical protein
MPFESTTDCSQSGCAQLLRKRKERESEKTGEMHANSSLTGKQNGEQAGN